MAGSKQPQTNLEGMVDYSAFRMSESLAENLSMIRTIFTGDDAVIIREFESRDGKIRCAAVYVDGMINTQMVVLSVIRPICSFERKRLDITGTTLDDIQSKLVSGNEVKRSQDIKTCVSTVLCGDTLVLTDGSQEALLVGSKGYATRAVIEPDNEKSLRGPREGFTESFMVNLSLIRRRLQTSDLKLSFLRLGTRTETRVCLCYLDSLVDKSVLKELRNRLSQISTDSVLCTNYLEEFVKDSRLSPFKTTGSSEKPDIVAARLLEGRVGVVVDGSPLVMTVPYLLIENFQAPDDYYVNFYYSSAGRLVRFLAFFLTISVPAVYVSLVGFHQEMIPDSLIAVLSAASSHTPFPVILECLGLLVVFDVLREAGIRSSNKIGQALSIVGGLVVGQAAIEAKIIGAPTLIVVALTGITGMLVSKLSSAGLLIRTGALLMSAFVGLFGYFFVMVMVSIHLLSLQSFGCDYMSGLTTLKSNMAQDVLFRAPIWNMKTRPQFARNTRRQK